MTQQIELTNMCMLYDQSKDQVLIQHRIKKWKGVAFLGGHVEPGEAIVPSVIREVREETGLVVEAPRLCGIVHWVNQQTGNRTITSFFRAEKWRGSLLTGTEEGRNEWVPLASLRKMQLAPWFGDQLRVSMRMTRFKNAFTHMKYVTGKL